jgi:hypothetical protein
VGLLEDWCDKKGTKDDRKRYLTFVEKEDGREAIRDALADPDEPADDAADNEEVADDDEEKIEEEPLSQLIERLDATVFGSIEALDADQADLPRLLDEALKGSLWARQIEREGEGKKALHQLILQARANLIWKSTAEHARRGHFAMGVGLEAGLAIDTMACDLNALTDRADAAALSGEIDELAGSLDAHASIDVLDVTARNDIRPDAQSRAILDAH